MRERLRERGLGLREFCRAAGLDPSFFSKVLSGKRSPPSEEAVLRRIAKILELDAASLIVSSGRIPEEWRSLWEDSSVFLAVHQVATGRAPSRPAPRAPGRDPRPIRPVPKKAFGEELL